MVASGRTPAHRAWGLACISLCSVIAYSILVAEMAVLKRGEAQGVAAQRFAVVTLCAWPLMVGMYTPALSTSNGPKCTSV